MKISLKMRVFIVFFGVLFLLAAASSFHRHALYHPLHHQAAE